jgi:hypothetical protein
MVYEKVATGIFVKEGIVIPRPFSEDDKKGYIYLCLIRDNATGRVWLKVGTTCNIMQRMTRHRYTFQSDIIILWISPAVSKYTTLKVEDEFKDFTKNHLEWEYVPQDRFFMPENTLQIEVRIRKTYIIDLS